MAPTWSVLEDRCELGPTVTGLRPRGVLNGCQEGLASSCDSDVRSPGAMHRMRARIRLSSAGLIC